MNFHIWTVILKRYGGISVLIRLFFNWSISIYSKYKLSIFSSLCILVPIFYSFYIFYFVASLQFASASNLYQIWSQFSAINLTQVLELKLRLIVEDRGNIQCNKKMTPLALHFLRKYPIWDFLKKFIAKRALCPQKHIFNKINRGIVPKPDEVGT